MASTIPALADPLTAAETVVCARAVTKHYGAVHAVDGIDLDIARGELFGLIGHNGAGKSTLFKMMLGLIPLTSGEILIDHASVSGSGFRAVRRKIGYLPENIVLYDNLTGLETLQFFSRLKGAPLKECAPALDRVGLTHAATRRVREYSKGMRQRLGFAQALLGRPQILFLDEPTTGLDPSARKSVWRMIRALAGGGVTILLTTQYLEEADQLAERIAVIDHGRKIAEGTSRELKAATGSGFLHVTLTDPGRIDAAAQLLERQLGGEAQRNAEGAVLSIKANSPHQANAALAALAAAGISIEGFSMAAPSLDEVFFALTGHGAESAPATGVSK